GRGGVGLGRAESLSAVAAEANQRDFLFEEPVPGGSAGPPAFFDHGGGDRPGRSLGRGSRTADRGSDPAGLRRGFSAAGGNQLRRVSGVGNRRGAQARFS